MDVDNDNVSVSSLSTQSFVVEENPPSFAEVAGERNMDVLFYGTRYKQSQWKKHVLVHRGRRIYHFKSRDDAAPKESYIISASCSSRYEGRKYEQNHVLRFFIRAKAVFFAFPTKDDALLWDSIVGELSGKVLATTLTKGNKPPRTFTTRAQEQEQSTSTTTATTAAAAPTPEPVTPLPAAAAIMGRQNGGRSASASVTNPAKQSKHNKSASTTATPDKSRLSSAPPSAAETRSGGSNSLPTGPPPGVGEETLPAISTPTGEVKSGWLQKKGGTGLRNNWRRRWIIATVGTIRYYDGEPGPGRPAPTLKGELLEFFAVEDINDPTKRNEYRFVAHASRRSLIMRAASADERAAWIVALKRLVTKRPSGPVLRFRPSNASSTSEKTATSEATTVEVQEYRTLSDGDDSDDNDEPDATRLSVMNYSLNSSLDSALKAADGKEPDLSVASTPPPTSTLNSLDKKSFMLTPDVFGLPPVQRDASSPALPPRDARLSVSASRRMTISEKSEPVPVSPIVAAQPAPASPLGTPTSPLGPSPLGTPTATPETARAKPDLSVDTSPPMGTAAAPTDGAPPPSLPPRNSIGRRPTLTKKTGAQPGTSPGSDGAVSPVLLAAGAGVAVVAVAGGAAVVASRDSTSPTPPATNTTTATTTTATQPVPIPGASSTPATPTGVAVAYVAVPSSPKRTVDTARMQAAPVRVSAATTVASTASTATAVVIKPAATVRAVKVVEVPKRSPLDTTKIIVNNALSDLKSDPKAGHHAAEIVRRVALAVIDNRLDELAIAALRPPPLAPSPAAVARLEAARVKRDQEAQRRKAEVEKAAEDERAAAAAAEANSRLSRRVGAIDAGTTTSQAPAKKPAVRPWRALPQAASAYLNNPGREINKPEMDDITDVPRGVVGRWVQNYEKITFAALPAGPTLIKRGLAS